MRSLISAKGRLTPNGSLVYSIFSAPPDKWLMIALARELVMILILVQIPGVRQAFGNAISSPADLVLVTVIGFLVMAMIESSKILLRRYMVAR